MIFQEKGKTPGPQALVSLRSFRVTVTDQTQKMIKPINISFDMNRDASAGCAIWPMKTNEFPSTIRYSLYAGLLLILTILGLSVLSSIWGLQRAIHYLERANHSYEQLAQVSTLEATINQYLLSEIATIVNFHNRDQLVQANPSIITNELSELQSSIDEENDFIKTKGGSDDIREEINTAINIASVFIRMHLAAKHETKTRLGLDSAAAVRRFFANVVEGNDKELSQVVRDIVKGEQEEVEEVKKEIETLTSRVTVTTTVLTILTTLGVLILAYFLTRWIVGPLQKLASGADKFAAGKLGFRIELEREDEFGLVANRFNKMAEQIASQQNLLRSANERLEVAVKERTSELKDSNDRLRQIDETRRRFFSNVSHELRTPITVLLGEAEVALRGRAATIDDLKSALKRIVANGAYLRRRLNDLLGLAQSDDGEIKLERRDSLVNEVVEEAIDAAAAYAEANDVSLKFDPQDKDFIASLDQSWFRQCLLILIDNAVKFSRPADQVTISLKDADPGAGEGNTHLLIEVADEGPGVEQEALDHLFERYYQASEGQKREGTGLGLAIAKWIVEGHEGEIWAENGPDKGAIITVKVKQL